MPKKVIKEVPQVPDVDDEAKEEVEVKTPQKVKAPCSEKLKEHLNHIRQLAVEKRKKIADEKSKARQLEVEERRYKASKYDEIKKEKEEAKLKAE